MPRTRFVIPALLLAFAVGCGGERAADSAATSEPAASNLVITVYSGRNEALIEPLIDRFRKESGIDVKVRYGDTAELAATLMEEGARTPADVYIAQDAGALGALSERGLFQPLPDGVIQKVPARFRSPSGDWVGVSGRARSVVFDPAKIREADLPRTLEAVGDPRYRGRFGVAPTNGSFQAHMAVYHAVNGREALETLLAALAANEPRRYPKNSTIVEAVRRGEIDFGLVNHYYLWQAKKEQPDLALANYFMPEGEASSFVNVAGVGILKRHPASEQFVAYLLSNDAQQYFATETFEYPLVEGVQPSGELQPLTQIRTPEVSMARVSELLPETLTMIQRSGLVQ